jgi:protoheme IX farnesyltransferase
MRDYALHTDVAVRGGLRDYFVLAKPGIVALVLVSALTGIFLGSRGAADSALILMALLGIGTATAGAAVLNNYFDRDIDPLMERTSGRALAKGTIAPASALMLGSALVAASVPLLAIGVNPLTAGLTMLAVFTYVVLYGMVLKRRSPAANQIGGLSGALPPVLGYAAVTGSVGVEALILFAIVAIWQQPHALSLALKYRADYAKASIPVIPVAKGVPATKWRIFFYTVLLLPASAMPYLTGVAGQWYLATAIVAGLVYLALSTRFLASRRSCDMFLFFYSIVYLTLLFSSMVLDMGAA